MKQYLKLCQKIIDKGVWKQNRTGTRCLTVHDEMMKFNLFEGFPVMTTKQLSIITCIGEMLGFLRGYTSAVQFRELGCNVWNANANKNEAWLNNPYREGPDDLGPIYGSQARRWPMVEIVPSILPGKFSLKQDSMDQLKNVITDLGKRIDNRREIISHWNPGEMFKMSLPPCHMMYQFHLRGEILDMGMYQRSCDIPLGVPFNIAGYAWLLSVVAHITGLIPGVFTWFGGDVHIYENQLNIMKETQLRRMPYSPPRLQINDKIKTLGDLETWVMPSDFQLIGYVHHPKIKYPFSV